MSRWPYAPAAAGVALALTLVLGLGACTVAEPTAGLAGGPAASTTAPRDLIATDAPYVRDGIFGRLGEGMPARLEITGVHREPDRTALRMAFTPTGDEPRGIAALGVDGLADSTLSGFQLLDPVGQRIYYPLFLSSSEQLASRISLLHQWRPGVTYELVAYFPRLAANATRVTVMTPGSTGAYTGVPVTEVSDPDAVAIEEPSANPAPGDRVALRVVREPLAGAEQRVADLYGVTERVVQARVQSAGWAFARFALAPHAAGSPTAAVLHSAARIAVPSALWIRPILAAADRRSVL